MNRGSEDLNQKTRKNMLERLYPCNSKPQKGWSEFSFHFFSSRIKKREMHIYVYVYVLSNHWTFSSILFLPLSLSIFCCFKFPSLAMILCWWRAVLGLRMKTKKSISFSVCIYTYMCIYIYIQIFLYTSAYMKTHHTQDLIKEFLCIFIYINVHIYTLTPLWIQYWSQ